VKQVVRKSLTKLLRLRKNTGRKILNFQINNPEHPVLIYFYNLASGITILANVILGGSPKESLSARNWELKRQTKKHWVDFINKLFMDDIHCLDSWLKWKVPSREFTHTKIEKHLENYYKYDGYYD
jgi:hypothetical protein